MGYKVNLKDMDQALNILSEKYRIYAPAWDRAKKNVRFRPVKSAAEIVLDRQSDFSMKEVYYPISQTMFYFKADCIEEPAVDDRDILIFARPCDINSILRLDTIFLKNGQPDHYYAKMREKVKFILLECKAGFEDCFCVSTGSNIADDYVMAVRFEQDSEGLISDIFVQVCDEEFDTLFGNAPAADFDPEFVSENKKVLNVPEITKDMIKPISALEYWSQFDDKCIGCGGCNTVCGTCSCFDTSDIIYEQGKPDGERRRIWSSCMLANFTETAGGVRSRKTPGANMRFKVFHKFYDFRARFVEMHMCVGCGRCDMRCPKDISFFDTVAGLNKEIEALGSEVEK